MQYAVAKAGWWSLAHGNSAAKAAYSVSSQQAAEGEGKLWLNTPVYLPNNTATPSAIFRGGTGSPEGAVTATVGSLYIRTDGGAGTTFCVKESGTGNTGWVCK
jgi:hypothetical protein